MLPPWERIKKEKVKIPPAPQKLIEITETLPEKPSFKETWVMRILVLFVVLLIAGGIISFFYWYFRIREKPLPPSPVPLVPKEETLPVVEDELILPVIEEEPVLPPLAPTEVLPPDVEE